MTPAHPSESLESRDLEIVKCRVKAPPLKAVQVTEDNLDALVTWTGRVTDPLPETARKYWHVGDWYVKGGNNGGLCTNDEFERWYDRA